MSRSEQPSPVPPPFERRQRFCQYWLNTAEALRRGAEAVWDAGDEFDRCVFRMLCGMALEALLKGAIVGKGGKPAAATHKLVQLAAEAGLKVSAKDKGLLQVLTHAIVWEGRYPAPKPDNEEVWKDFNRLWDQFCSDKSPIGKFTLLSPNNALDWAGFDRLWQATESIFWQRYQEAQHRRISEFRRTGLGPGG